MVPLTTAMATCEAPPSTPPPWVATPAAPEAVPTAAATGASPLPITGCDGSPTYVGASAPEHAAISDDPTTRATTLQFELSFFIR